MHAVSSMTGYAVAEGLSPLGKISVECRAVNSRFLDLTLRMDESLRFADGLVREQIQKRVARGKMEVRISLKASEAGLPTSLNEAALRRIAELQASIRKVIPETPPLTVAELLEMPGIAETAGADRDELAASILKVLDEALTAFSAARRREGEALAKVLLDYCAQMEATVEEVRAEIPRIIAHVEGKLTERLEDALASALTEKSTLTREEVSDRIRQEVTLYAIRLDVDEEMNRLVTHLNEVRRILEKGGPVGRRLDFMAQEMNREANTLGSKAAAIEITNASMALKVVIEQLREQIQNLE